MLERILSFRKGFILGLGCRFLGSKYRDLICLWNSIFLAYPSTWILGPFKSWIWHLVFLSGVHQHDSCGKSQECVLVCYICPHMLSLPLTVAYLCVCDINLLFSLRRQGQQRLPSDPVSLSYEAKKYEFSQGYPCTQFWPRHCKYRNPLSENFIVHP